MICIKPARNSFLVLSSLWWICSAGAQAIPQPRLPTVTLTAGTHRITAEVADQPQTQAIGMMGRRMMALNDGMLFVDSEPRTRKCFWMSNTLIPLSIAFVADDGTVQQVNDMQPQTTTEHCYQGKPIRYALEMNQGWFKQRGIGPGFKLRGPPFGS
jgi:hypothetical protein